MNETHCCPKCGAALGHSEFGGLCPRCIVTVGLAASTAGEAGLTTIAGEPQANPRRGLLSGEDFGPYRILQFLGRGGMGEVYEAEERDSGRRLALKIMSRALSSEMDRKRFLREGRLAASVSHPNVVYIYGSEEVQGVPVIAMELVAGGNLQERVKQQGPLSVTEAVESILQIINGLEAAYAGGVLHRDIKPANCFVDSDGAIKIGDFGLSIATATRSESALTAPGSVLGTPAFAPPEQLRGEPVELAADIYSVGATLYCLITGQPPFAAGDLVKLIADVLQKAPRAPSSLRSDIPRALSKVILRCLSKEPAVRYKSYDRLRQALLPFASTALDPATLKVRVGAGLIDITLVFAIVTFVFCEAVYLTIGSAPFYDKKAWSQLFDVSKSGAALASFLASLAFQMLYFAIPEWRWGASPGKLLLNLRVKDLRGGRVGFGRALFRSCWFLVPPAAIQLFCYFVISPGPLQFWAAPLAFYVWLILLIATMRQKNGYAEIHDLLSGTRVVKEVVQRTACRLEPAGAPGPVSEAAGRLGPYAILDSLWKHDTEELLLAYDERLRRKVWLHRGSIDAPAVSPQHRNLARVGRLRWLTGRRNAAESWDAYAAPEGQPLLTLPPREQPWGQLRLWLHDLAEEYAAGLRTSSLPTRLDQGRVWITSGGRAMLLEFRAPGLDAQGPPEPCFAASSAAAMQEFLADVTSAALSGSATLRPSARPTPVCLPQHAQPFLAALHKRAFPSPEALLANVSSLLSRRPVLSWRRRLSMVLACAFLLLMPGLISVLVNWHNAFAMTSKDGIALRICLFELYAQRSLPVEQRDLKVQEALEVCLAHRVSPLITNALWLKYNGSLPQPELQSLRDLAAKHPHPPPEQIEAAISLLNQHGSFLVKKWLEKWRSEDGPGASAWAMLTRRQLTWMASYLLWGIGISLRIIVLPSLLMALLCRGGLLLWAFGAAVVKRDGGRASRIQILWRTVLTWAIPGAIGVLNAWTAGFLPLPAWLASRMMAWFDWRFSWPWPPGVGVQLALLAIFGAGALWLVWRPTRGWQDTLAGTCVVPK